MADDVKQLLISVDASVALLRQNLLRGDQIIQGFERSTNTALDRIDRRFGQTGRPLGGIGDTVARARTQVSSLGNSVDAVERRIRASSTSIRSSLLTATSGIAAAFSLNKVKDFADGYTRFTNQLKIAGLEGNGLAGTQDRLFAIAQKYGVQLEQLGSLYGRASQAGKALGASQEDLLKLTAAVGAAQKVQGGTAEQSAGAILQLSQALGTGTVRAEEFNSVNEGLRPILQAAADASDKYKGSVQNLRNDVIAGKVSSKELFDLLLAGLPQLEKQAAKATLTIGASFTVLNNAIGKYIGEADQSLGVTERISAGMTGLANNLDTLALALAVIGVSFAANRIAAAAFTRDFISGMGGAGAATRIWTQQLAASTATRIWGEELTRGNVQMLGSKVAAAQRAEAIAAGARVEVASIEATIAARKAEQIQVAAQIVAERELAATRRAAAALAAASNVAGAPRTAAIAAQRTAENDAAFASQRLTAARQRQVAVDVELAAAESALAAAQARAAATTAAASAAAAEATLAARAAATASRLFAGGLTLIGGSVAGGAAVLVIAALIAAVIHFRSEAEETTRSLKDFADHQKTAGETSKELALYAGGAASGIASVGAQASAATPGVQGFAASVADAAKQLRDLAAARKAELVAHIQTDISNANADAAAAKARLDRTAATNAVAPGRGALDVLGRLLATPPATAKRDQDAFAAAQATARQKQQELAQAKAIPLDNFMPTADNNRARDLSTADSLRTTRRDLTVAQQSGDKAQIADLKARVFELTQYQGYRKQGLSAEASIAQAAKDKAAFEQASGEKADRIAGAKSVRERAAEQRKAAAAEKDDAGDAKAFSAAERQANDAIAAARADLSGSAVERAQIEKDRIEAERKSRNDEIAYQAKQGRFGSGDTAKARVTVLQGLNDQRASLETDVLAAREKQRKADEELAIASAGRSNQTDLLKSQENLATTAKRRRELELQLLDIQYQEEKARLEAVVASRDSTEAEKKIAEARLRILGQLQANDTANVKQQNAGPMDQYRQRLHTATDDMNAALEGVKVDGLQSLEDGLVGIISGTESVGSAFKKMADQIIADLARIYIEKFILGLIGGMANGGEVGGGSGGGYKDGGLPAFAGGGLPRYDGGGRIRGPGTGRSDSIIAMVNGKKPIRVSNGEFIVNAQATSANLPLLKRINAGHMPGYADGGLIQVPVPGNMAGKVGNSSLSISMPVSIMAPGADAEALGRVERQVQQLQATLPATIVSTVYDARQRGMIA